MNDQKCRLSMGLTLLLLLVTGGAFGQPLVNPEIEKKIDELLQKMTLEEKIGQMNQYSSAFDLTGPPPQGGGGRAQYDQIRNGQHMGSSPWNNIKFPLTQFLEGDIELLP